MERRAFAPPDGLAGLTSKTFSFRRSVNHFAGALLSKATLLGPRQAQASHIGGVVVLYAMIGKDGLTKDLSPVWSPDKLLTDAAVDAIRQWTYRSYVVDGEPVEVEATITLHFSRG